MAVRDNTNRRLKEVLEIMAAGSWLDEKPNGGVVLAEAVARIPFTKEESELLSGGIPRGHKNLTKATAGLVKAGWMSKGRGGWEITENGLRATVAFDTVEKLTDALNNDTLIPAGTALPEKPAAKVAPKQAVSGRGLENQPASVALAGTFGEGLGAKNWDPSHDAVQMNLDPRHGVWLLTAELPAGQYSYKAVVNGSWDENYGAFGINNGANHEFSHNGGTVTFRYDHATKDVLRA
ncbi:MULTISPECIES: pullulanase X25 domain-containing protein [Arthrobacter]|uniref:pullulanase X25 domain-containing protein n=1 Tax=unclassified Arthrobacter TaxID=235627 RepID=UPI0024B8E92B|nr:glycosidase [Arthrobacter sp. H35-MC1]MDJ0317312.1 glycosidase [Arthrobacter sp. H35-MC1]